MRQQLLVDYILDPTSPGRKLIADIPAMGPTLNMWSKNIRSSQRFIFDAAASEKVMHTLESVPDLICANSVFARPPFDASWLELTVDWIGEGPTQFGFFFHDPGFMFFIKRANGQKFGFSPLICFLNCPEVPENADRGRHILYDYLKVDRALVDEYLWGRYLPKIPLPVRDNWHRQHSVSSLFTFLGAGEECSPQTAETFHSSMLVSSGLAALGIAALLLLNRPAVTQISDEIPAHRGFSKGKLKHFLSHSTVTISLDPVPYVRRMGTPAGSGDTRRRHEVEGHWCSNEDARLGSQRGCVHDWVRDPKALREGEDPRDRWICQSCSGKRWWRRKHERGTAEKGFVVRDGYLVVP